VEDGRLRPADRLDVVRPLARRLEPNAHCEHEFNIDTIQSKRSHVIVS
jgi:hypothetical protein